MDKIYPEVYPDAETAPVGDQVPLAEDPNDAKTWKAGSTTAPAPSLLPHKVVVWFDFAKGDFRDKSRIILNGVVDIRTQADLEAVEGLVREQLGHDRVMITNWKKLEG